MQKHTKRNVNKRTMQLQLKEREREREKAIMARNNENKHTIFAFIR